MNFILQKLAIALVSPLIALLGFAGYSINTPTQNFGSTIPVVNAVFETSLASSIASSDTSMTLASGVDQAGHSLSGYTCFTVDSGQSNAEFICGTAAGTSITSLVRGIDTLTGTTTVAALQFSHRRGADVKISDYPTLGIISRILSGADTLPSTISYGSAQTPTFGKFNIPTWDYVKTYADGLAIAGAPNADTVTKGIVQIATAIQSASSTPTGSTAATIVIPASTATSSPKRGCDGTSVQGALCVVVAQNDGTINPLFISTSTPNYTWGGTHTFTKTIVSGFSSTTYSGSTVNIDWSAGQTAMVQLNQSTTITFSNVTTGTAIRAVVCQDGTGSRTVSAYPAGILWQGGFAPTLTTTANKCDIISFLTGSSTASVYGAASSNF